MILAFTGTRYGMTAPQQEGVRLALTSHGVVELHHGDAVGADAQAAAIARTLTSRPKIVAHPPLVITLRAYAPHADVTLPAKEYHARNRDIVDAGQALLACPAESAPQPQGGTWHTVRCARLAQKPILIIWPDGSTDGSLTPTLPTDPAALLAHLRGAELVLRVDAGRLLVSPPERITPALAGAIRTHRDALVALLTLPETVPPAIEPLSVEAFPSEGETDPAAWQALLTWLGSVIPTRPAPWVLGRDRCGRPWHWIDDPPRYLALLRERVRWHQEGPAVGAPGARPLPHWLAQRERLLATEVTALKAFLAEGG